MITKRMLSFRPKNSSKTVKNKAGKDATAYIYGDIGGWFGIDHLDWIKELNAIDADTIHLRIDSDGGDVFAARAMKTAIMQHKAKVVAHIDGLAASAASFLAMGADEIEIVDGGFVMVHNAASILDILGFFNIEAIDELIDELQKERGLHEKMNKSIASDYMKRSGKDFETVSGWMDAVTWFTADEALENGLVDRVYDGKPVEAKYDLSRYANVPDELVQRNQEPSRRDLEKTLRDAGCSRAQAKSILSGGLPDDLRDAENPKDEPVQVVNQRDAGEPDQREADEPEKKKKDRVAELLIRAEKIKSTLNEEIDA